MSHITLEELLASDVYADEDKEKRAQKKTFIAENLIFSTMEVCGVLQITRATLYAKGLGKDHIVREAYNEGKGWSIGAGKIGVTSEGVLAAASPRVFGRLSTVCRNYKDLGIEVGNDEPWRIQIDVLTALYNEGIIDIEPVKGWMKISGKEMIKTNSNKTWKIKRPTWREEAGTRQNEIYENIFLILNVLLREFKMKIEFNEILTKIEFVSLG